MFPAIRIGPNVGCLQGGQRALSRDRATPSVKVSDNQTESALSETEGWIKVGSPYRACGSAYPEG